MDTTMTSGTTAGTTAEMTTGMATGWWDCAECGVDAELAAGATAGCEVPCPDCGGPMVEQWQWDAAA